MATINLGAIKFNWKGAYNSGTSYAVDDVVSSGGNSYVCIQAHSNQAVGNATAYWNIMSSAGTNGTNGTNGTDVGTVITTQGDILYRDGSGLQRLPKGTAGQVLKMNSSANAPEYGTLSSDYVKIASADATGNPASIFFSDVFTSDYTTYKLFAESMYASASTHFNVRFTTTGTNEITSGYYMAGPFTYYNHATNASTNLSHRRHHNDGTFRFLEENAGTSQAYSTWSEFTIFNPRQSGEYKLANWRTSIRSSNNFHYTAEQHGYLAETSNVMNGIRIFPSAGVWNGGRWTLYGIK